MKVLAGLLLCAFAAVQGRSAGAQKSTALAALGENPWLVHLRLAVSTSGLLNTGAGSLIHERWVLTAAEAVEDARFIWVRYGVVNVINPSLVTETSVDPAAVSNTIKVNAGVALISINRFVQPTANIAPVSLGSVVPESAQFYSFGVNEEGGPGEILSYFEVALESQDDGTVLATSDDGKASKFDLGAPLVEDGKQVAVLIAGGDDSNAGTFRPLADLFEWIESETGLSLSPGAVEPEESLIVKVVN